MSKQTNWREDPGLESITTYSKHIAIFPKKCNGEWVWPGQNYYTRKVIWCYRTGDKLRNNSGKHSPGKYFHIDTDTHESITEADYLMLVLNGE